MKRYREMVDIIVSKYISSFESHKMHFGSNNFEFGWLLVLVGTHICKEKGKKFEKKVWTKNWGTFFYVLMWCYCISFPVVVRGSRVKKSKLLRMTLTHFDFGIFEIWWHFWNFASGHNQGSISILVQIILNLDDFLFWWGEHVCEEKDKKNWKISLIKSLN